MATVTVFLALGRASYAAFNLPANSVGTKQLKTGAVTGAKIRSRSLHGNVLANGSVIGRQINSGTLGTVPKATNAAHAALATNSDKLGGLPASAYVTGPAEAWHEVTSFNSCNGTPTFDLW